MRLNQLDFASVNSGREITFEHMFSKEISDLNKKLQQTSMN